MDDRDFQTKLRQRVSASEATLRDQIAMAALAGLISHLSAVRFDSTYPAYAYQYADAMLDAREK